ncbi:MAG: CheR family methyltransferase, partial [Bacteroidota bacterium]
FKDKGLDDQVRVWSVGCATGEEAYSLAILLLEEASNLQYSPTIQVFASDMHERSLKMAREGFYPGDIELDVSTERLRRFFIKEDGGYRVRKEVREMVIFTPHNLLNDPPFSKLDMIVCRNLLIYLKREVQQDVFDLFHYALLPDGVLVLGTSEHLESSELFRTKHKDHSFHIKRNITGPEPKLPVFPLSKPNFKIENQVTGDYNYQPVSFGKLHQRMVERYAPPSILVSLEYQVLHLSEHAGRYLVYPGGEPTQHLFKLIREELRIELRGALQEAREKDELIRSKPVELKLDGQAKQVRISVRMTDEPDHEKFALIMFEEELLPAKSSKKSDVKINGKQNGELEDELKLTQQRLQAIIEEYETTQEEMKASNEELQSANEELRSTMEELETSKEELQSMNEELSTVNQENRHKVDELSQLSSDLQNLLAATDIATLFLDREFQILRFTPKVGEIFSIRSADKGRPLTDLTHRLGYPQLFNDAQDVLQKLIPVEREVQDDKSRWYLTRVLPYRSSRDRIEGVVITFVDITSRKNAEEALRQSEEQFRALVEASSPTIWTTNAAGEVEEDSPSWRAFTGQSYQEWKGDGWINAIHPEDRETTTHKWRQSVAEEKIFNVNYRLWHQDANEWRWTSVRAVPLRNADGTLRGWMGMNIDINELKMAESALRETSELLDMARLASKLGWGTWDFDKDEVYWDDRGKEIFSFEKNCNHLQDWMAIILPEDKPKVEELLDTCRSKGKDFDLEFRIIPDKEEVRYVHVTAAFKEKADGNKKGTGHVRDITDKKLLQKQKDDFMSMASHEMKTPVAVMKGYVEMILEILESKENRSQEAELIKKVSDQVKRLTNLINSLLDITLIESGKIDYNQEEFDFDSLVSETVESMQRIAKQELLMDGTTGKKILGDRDRIGQVIINFISNAIKYSPGKEKIIVSNKIVDNEVQLSVQDYGKGIDEKDKELIFDRYFRAKEHSSSTPGLGLGLYISSQIIQRHHGRIWVESVKGDG